MVTRNEVTGLVQILEGFTGRTAPGIVVSLLLLIVLTRQLKDFRICVHLLLFVLFRDSMMPLRLWRLTSDLDIEFLLSSFALVVLGLLSVLVVVITYFAESDLCSSVSSAWIRTSSSRGFGLGTLAGVLVAVLVSFGKTQLSTSSRLMVSLAPTNQSWLAVLFFSLCTSLYEEFLFRGILQGRLEELVSPVRAALASTLFFVCFHIGLAFTVTSIGTPVLMFMAIEGLVASFARLHFGILPATVFRGVLVFLLASGISDGIFR